MVYYKLIKVKIHILIQAKVIINVIVYQHGVLESIVTNWDLLFISKFWFLPYYFLEIKKSYLQPSTHRYIARQRDKTVQ